METKDLATAMAAVSVILAAPGPVPDIVATVHAFTSRFAGTRVEGLPHEAGSGVRERLAQLEQLHAEGVITEAEHAQQRARMRNSQDLWIGCVRRLADHLLIRRVVRRA